MFWSKSSISARVLCVTVIMTILAGAASQETVEIELGMDICTEGFVMDFFCIDRGTLLDKPSVESLRNPERHSVHCLIDVSSCVNSGYEILLDPQEGQELYARLFALDDAGNNMVRELAARTGLRDGSPRCTECTGEGSLQEGFRATVNGTVTFLGDSSNPARIAVTSVQDSSVGCGNVTFMPANLVFEAGTLTNKIYAHGSLMLIGWGWMLPSGAIIARLFKHRPNGVWFKLHRFLQTFGLILAICGWGVAIKNFDVFGTKGLDSYKHGVLGMTTMAIGIIQPLNAILRPHPPADGEMKTSTRALWEFIHKGLGYCALLLAVVTIGYGTTLLPKEEDQKAFQIAYGAGCGGILLLLILFLLYDKKNYVDQEVNSPPPGKTTEEFIEEGPQ